MIPSPTAVKKCPAAGDVKLCEFNQKPVGAGPFKIDSYKTKDSITMLKNADYFGGAPYLDGLKFVNSIADAGGDSDLPRAHHRHVQHGIPSRPCRRCCGPQKKFDGVSTIEQGGGILLINQGNSVNCAAGAPAPICTGKPDGVLVSNPPTKDLKSPSAIAAAVDPKVINDRGSGQGIDRQPTAPERFPVVQRCAGPEGRCRSGQETGH